MQVELLCYVQTGSNLFCHLVARSQQRTFHNLSALHRSTLWGASIINLNLVTTQVAGGFADSLRSRSLTT